MGLNIKKRRPKTNNSIAFLRIHHWPSLRFCCPYRYWKILKNAFVTLRGYFNNFNYRRVRKWRRHVGYEGKLLPVFQESFTRTSTKPQELHMVQRQSLLPANRARPYFSFSSSTPRSQREVFAIHKFLDVLRLFAGSESILRKRKVDGLWSFLRQMVRRLWRIKT